MTADEAATLLLGWVPSSVGEMANLNPSNPDRVPPDETEVSFVPMASVEALSGVMHPSARRTWRTVRKGYKRFQDGDVLVAKITPSMENGKAALASQLIGGVGAGSTEFHVIRPTEALVGKFLLHFLLQESVRREARAHMTGTAGQLRVPESFYESLGLHLPPINEQHRIVQTLDSYFTRLDAARAALEGVQANLKRYRASVLKAAVGGKLVPTEAELARKEGRDYEPADQLLERILAERRARWESQEKRRGTYKKPVSADISGLSELPEGWVWCSVAQLAHVGTGSTPLTSKQQFYQNGTLPWITSSALNKPSITSPSSFVTEQAVREYRLSFYPPHTLLVAMYGEGRTRGKCSELLIRSTINQAIAAITMEGSASDCRQYARVFLNNNYEETRRLSSGGVQPNLNLGLVGQITAPLPPLAEQRCIVAEVERRLSVIQQAEATVEANLVRAERLRQSILKQAFSGRLVPRDPSDEPATVMLERIRLEREASHADAKASRQPRPRRTKPISARQLMPREGNP